MRTRIFWHIRPHVLSCMALLQAYLFISLQRAFALNILFYVKDDFLNIVFKAIGEATEEAVLNAMLNAHEAKTIQGKTCHSLRDYFDLILEEFKE